MQLGKFPFQNIEPMEGNTPECAGDQTSPIQMETGGLQGIRKRGKGVKD